MATYVLWGCNPTLQYETPWILHLLADNSIIQIPLYDGIAQFPQITSNDKPMFLEISITTGLVCSDQISDRFL